MRPSTPTASGILVFLLAVVTFIFLLMLFSGCAAIAPGPDFYSPNPIIPRGEVPWKKGW